LAVNTQGQKQENQAMKIPFKASVLSAALAGLLAGTAAVWADEDLPETDVTDSEVAEAVSAVPAGKIAGYFTDFLGGEAESQSLVDGLRDGSVHYLAPVTGDGETADPEAPETEDVATGMGYGNVLITLALAEQLAGQSAAEIPEGETGMTAEESVNEILRMRQEESMGWGQIARELGVNLGEVISGIRSNRPEKVIDAMAVRVDKAHKAEHLAKVERPERPGR
jgi:hypothetical protein